MLSLTLLSPVTKDCIEKLKGLNGVKVDEIEEDD